MNPNRAFHDDFATSGSVGAAATRVDAPVMATSLAAWKSASSLAVAGVDAGRLACGAFGSGDVK